MSSYASYRLDIPQCQHVKDDGLRCGSPALRGQPFCYNHDKIYNPRLQPGQKAYQFGPLEGQASIELFVRSIFQSYHDGRLNDRQTRMYLYGISIIAPYACRGRYVYPPHVTSDLPPAMQAVRDESLAPFPTANLACSLATSASSSVNLPSSSADSGLCSADTPVRETPASSPAADATSTEPTESDLPITSSPDHLIPDAQTTTSPAADTSSTEPSHGAADSNSPARSAGYAPTETSPSAVGTTESDLRIRNSIFHPDPAAVRAYWTQHLTPEDVELRLPSGQLIYTPPTWLPLTEEQLQYLRDNLPPDRGPATPEQQENLERSVLHGTHGHVTPPLPEEIRSLHRDAHKHEKEWDDTYHRLKKITAQYQQVFQRDQKKERA